MLFTKGALVSIPVGILAASGVTAQINRNCTTNFDPNADYFPNKAVIRPGAKVGITYFGYYKIVTETLSNATEPYQYVLYQCGTQRPPASALPAGISGIFEVPIQSVITTGTTELSYLELLGARDSIKYTTNTEYVTSPCILKNALPSLPYYSASGMTAADSASWTAALAKVNMTIGGPATTRLENNIAVKFPATSDQARLGRADWLHFLGAFYNQEERANALVRNITDQYNCISDAAKSSAQALGAPDALWASYYDSVLTLGGTYTQTYLADAGASLPNVAASNSGADVTASTPYNVASQKAALEPILGNSEIFVTDMLNSVTDLYTWTGLTAADSKTYNITRTGQVWSANKAVSPLGSGLDWFASGVVNQHIVLADLASIIQPALLPGYVRKYFRNVATPENPVPASVDQCTAEMAASAEMLPMVICPTAVTSVTAANAINWNAAGAPLGGTQDASAFKTVSVVSFTVALTILATFVGVM
ncbi:hypothetical protein DFJ77DRAFT_453530 [Powellomyces hirtus]|nr:hypothetical protein DFJ77DRAFT_453530 [Powellomyces hirtus]